MLEQRTDAWLSERAGKVTASALHKVMARTKSGWGAERENYAAQLIAERLSGEPAQSFTNAAMQWGVDTEAQARAMYSISTGEAVMELGFQHHPTIAMAGASPDGLIGDKGLTEIKCPNTATHIKTLRGAAIDQKYIYQMQWQMACCEREWCDFVSFDPRLPMEMQMHVRRVERDDELLAKLESEVTVFLAEIDETVAELRAEYMKDKAA